MKTTIRINASSLKNSQCLRHWYWQVIEGYKVPIHSANIIYGVAVHSFIDKMFKTDGDIRASRDAALASFRIPKHDNRKSMHLSDERHLITVCMDVWDRWVLRDDSFDVIKLPTGLPATEVTFSIPFYEDELVEVLLEGTIDKVGKIKGGCYAIGDYKTTSSYQKDTYLSAYQISSQLRFYTLAVKMMARLAPESVLGQIGATNIGCFIDGIFLNPSPAKVEYQRSDVFQFSESDMFEFEFMLNKKVANLVAFAQERMLPMREGLMNGACEGKWGLCDFINVCKQSNPQVAELMLWRDFKKVEYNPLNHNAV